MKPIPLKEIQNLIAHSLPMAVSYERKRIKIGKGKKKRVQLKIAGATDDRMFFIMCWGSPVTRLEFMVPIIPVHLARTITVVKTILIHFFPDVIEPDDWFSKTVIGIGDNEKKTRKYEPFSLTVSRLDLYGQQIVMIDVK